MQTTLTDEELSTLGILANLRTMVNRACNVAVSKVSKSPSYEIELEGIIGEYAFCKIHNLFFDFIASPRSGSADCIYNGKRIDIKSTKYKNGKLLGHVNRNTDVDIFILAIVDNYTVTFPGWLYWHELYSDENYTMLSDSPVYAASQNKLRSWEGKQ